MNYIEHDTLCLVSANLLEMHMIRDLIPSELKTLGVLTCLPGDAYAQNPLKTSAVDTLK